MDRMRWQSTRAPLMHSIKHLYCTFTILTLSTLYLLSFDTTLSSNPHFLLFFFSLFLCVSAMASPLLPLLSLSRQSLVRPLSPYLQIAIKKYSRSSSGGIGGEKASSTAEEFQRVAAEKRMQQGPAEEKSGQTSEALKKEKYKEDSDSPEESKRKGG